MKLPLLYTPAFALLTALSPSLMAQGSIDSWGYNNWGQVTNTPQEMDFVQVAGGGYHSLALRGDGSIISWGNDGDGQVTNTPQVMDFVHVAGG